MRGTACLKDIALTRRPTSTAPLPCTSCLEGTTSARQPNDDGFTMRGAACLEDTSSTVRPTSMAPSSHASTLKAPSQQGGPTTTTSSQEAPPASRTSASTGRPTSKALTPRVAYLECTPSVGRLDNKGFVARGTANLEGITSAWRPTPTTSGLWGCYRSVILQGPWASRLVRGWGNYLLHLLAPRDLEAYR